MGKYWNMSEEARQKISDYAKKRYANRVIYKNCLVCNKEIRTTIARLESGRGLHCSKKCFYETQKGKRKSITTEFKKGQQPWNLGIPHRKETIMKMIGRDGIKGKENHLWKGEDVGYMGIHNWLYTNYGQPDCCEFCNKTDEKKYNWAKKIDCKYERKRENYIRLCRKCHHKYDDISYKLWSKRKK